ncbi:hypothetical protein UFOVP449_175 [uncultured Caudovirales phage]|uniref:Uncharacterized protein n=1 Tax=uncultured Caudovirales phage TaxID=2100421 RepID=A0A6J5MC89_9CAUD|nr:hypothetical protein UFOVP449_175 [uncultured Caudovirales phage]
MCIIVSKEINDKFILAKNRDRAYKPVLEVVHTLINGVEVAYLHDLTTDWSEGLNEFGIGIVNSALLVGHDEAEKKIVKKSGKPSKDGKKIRTSLSQKTLKETIKAALNVDGGINGHTFISSPYHMISIEKTSEHKADIRTHNIKSPVVRTNHGHVFSNAGYTHGIKYLSSKMRKISAEKTIERVKDWTQVAPAMRKQYFERESQLNMRRNTSSMFTSSQTIMNLTDRILEVEWFASKVQEFKGINNQLPKDYKPKIRIIIDKIDV